MTHSRTQHIVIEDESWNFQEMFSHDLQMYSEPPSGEIKLEELQAYCAERLTVLKLVESIWLQNRRKSPAEYKNILTQKLYECDLSDFAKLINGTGCESYTDLDLYIRRKDNVSHFMLRSAFAFENEKKRWFYKQEVRLFKWRFSSLDSEGIQAFNYANEFYYIPIPQEEKQEIITYLRDSTQSIIDIKNVIFYKVPFTDVSNLIRKRTVFLKDGMAFVPETKIGSLFVTHFKNNLCAGFEIAREVAANVCDDKRLTGIFKILPSLVEIKKSGFNTVGRTSIDELDELAEISYPLCMRILHEALRKNHHLTNFGRVQYTLFLKGIGVPLNDALKFWKDELTQKVTEARFDREYRYSVRHLYGQEGKRANYDPFGCFKIMNSKIGPRDSHGCPFKHMSSDALTEKLTKCGVTYSEDVKGIVNLAREGQYQKACSKYYEITHNRANDQIFKHPNVYFNQSQQLLAADADSDGE